MQYFGCNNIEGVAESWVDAEMSLVEVDGGVWSRVEVDGAGWRWVLGLAITKQHYRYFTFLIKKFSGNKYISNSI